MAAAVAEFKDVVKDYRTGLLGRGTLRAVDRVSLAVQPGEVFALLGPNRAGKTTLVKMLLSLCRPTSGQANRFGRPVGERRTLARVGYVHEHPAFPRYLTAPHLLQYYAALAFVPFEVVQGRVPALLERVGLADRQREPIAQFSKGMVQRLAVAQALINEPDLLVLDEPMEGLDLPGRKLVEDIVRELGRQGKTVLLVSHVLSEVEKLCQRVAVLVGGRLVYQGTMAELTRGTDGGAPRPLEQALQDLYQRKR